VALTARRLPPLFAGLVVVAFALCACSFDFGSLQFTKDNRMTILSPKPNSMVKTPLVLRWSIRDFAVAGPHDGPVAKNVGYFGVFVDQSPVKPGQTLAAVGHNDPTCRHSNYCLTKGYLSGQQVYTTTANHLKLTTIADLPNNNLSTQYHTATIVLLNTTGHRIGESAWTVSFKMHAIGTGG